jgi:hypothetical protein
MLKWTCSCYHHVYKLYFVYISYKV